MLKQKKLERVVAVYGGKALSSTTKYQIILDRASLATVISHYES